MFGAKALVTANTERRRTGDERMIAVLFVVCMRLVSDRIGDVKLLVCIALFGSLTKYATYFALCNFVRFFTSAACVACVPILIPTY